MLWNTAKRFVREDDGMEMVEWAIVGVIFALGGAALWSTLSGHIQTALNNIGTCVSTSSC